VYNEHYAFDPVYPGCQNFQEFIERVEASQPNTSLGNGEDYVYDCSYPHAEQFKHPPRVFRCFTRHPLIKIKIAATHDQRSIFSSRDIHWFRGGWNEKPKVCEVRKGRVQFPAATIIVFHIHTPGFGQPGAWLCNELINEVGALTTIKLDYDHRIEDWFGLLPKFLANVEHFDEA
jgi:hypothetical protein